MLHRRAAPFVGRDSNLDRHSTHASYFPSFSVKPERRLDSPWPPVRLLANDATSHPCPGNKKRPFCQTAAATTFNTFPVSGFGFLIILFILRTFLLDFLSLLDSLLYPTFSFSSVPRVPARDCLTRLRVAAEKKRKETKRNHDGSIKVDTPTYD